jgi:hypothetical protein
MPSSRIDASDSIILFADLQAGIIELARTNPISRLISAVSGLAKLAKLFDIPAVYPEFKVRTEVLRK